jgi:hypothetical protein
MIGTNYDVLGRIILKVTLRGRMGLSRIRVTQDRGKRRGCCGHGDEFSHSNNVGEFLD